MTDTEQKSAARDFAAYWADKGYEKGQSQPFWLALLRDVLGIVHPEQTISFEDQVHLDHTSFIDGYIPSTRVLIEQKSRGKDLRAPIRQSDGSFLTPFQQAKRYCLELPVSKHPRWIVTCNFSEFLVYDMENPSGEPESILLENLPDEFPRLAFLANPESESLRREMEVSMLAGALCTTRPSRTSTRSSTRSSSTASAPNSPPSARSPSRGSATPAFSTTRGNSPRSTSSTRPAAPATSSPRPTAPSGAIVYNNFPWPEPTEEQIHAIEMTAQGILDARALYPDCTFKILYDELTMPQELRKAHQANDRAVLAAYGWAKDMPEPDIVAALFERYRALTEAKESEK